MEEPIKMSHDEVKKTIAQIYKEMEETLKNIEDNGTISEENRSLDDGTEALDENESIENSNDLSVIESGIGNEGQETVIEDDVKENVEVVQIGEDEIPSEDVQESQPMGVENQNKESTVVEDMAQTSQRQIHNAAEDEPVQDNVPDVQYREEYITCTSNDNAKSDFQDLDSDLMEMVKDLKSEIGRVVVGYDDIVENLLIALLAKGHVLLEGVPGIAKTTLAKTFTSILGMECQRIQFTPDMLPQDITGHFFYNQKKQDFEFRKGPIFSNLLLADEINRTTPRTQSALLESMEEGQTTIEGNTFQLPKPFMIIATINPIEHEGVYQLPQAQADRFMLKVNMGYVKKEHELEFLKIKANGNNELESPLNTFNISRLNKAFNNTYAEECIIEYINNIISETRNSDMITIGASPRASEHMLYVAKAKACISGRDYVIPNDVKEMAYDVLNHRLVLSPDLDPNEFSVGGLIHSILEKSKVPLERR